MTEPAPAAPEQPARYTVTQYFALVDQGVLEPDDKVELLVADSSLVQDRLTKAGIYAAACIPEYWIVVRRGDHVQVATNPVQAERRYGTVRIARRGEHITLVALPDVCVAVDDLLPPGDCRDA